MVRGFSFRLLYRVVFLCFSLSFACFYHHACGDGTKSKKIQNKFNGKPLNNVAFLKQDEGVPNLRTNVKHVVDKMTRKKANHPTMAKKGKFLQCAYVRKE